MTIQRSVDGTKLDLISITQAVDLDAIETRVNSLDAAVVLRGAWDASTGTFPGGGTAQAGDSYIVSVAGTVGGVAFAINDRAIAILDNASTTIFAGNWHKADYSDAYQTDAEIKTAYQAAVPLISQVNAEAGTATGIESWSALRVAQAIAALAGGGGAFTADVNTQITPSTAIVLDQATGDEVALDLSFTVNKLTSGNYTGLKLYATETSAPGTADLLMDLGVGVTSKFKVGNDGGITVVSATHRLGADIRLLDQYIILRNSTRIGWSATTIESGGDIYIKRASAGVLILTDTGEAAGGSLKLDLTTEDRDFINFNATADADATSAISTLTTSGAVTHHVQIKINGVKAWIPVSTTAPS